MNPLEKMVGYFSPKPESRASRRRAQSGPDLGRRRFLYLLAGGAATAVGGGGIATIQYLIEQAKINALIDEHAQKESQSEPLIQQFEIGFASFSDQALDLIKETDLTEAEKQGLQIPFEIFQINRENQDRNVYKHKGTSLKITRSLTGAQSLIENPNFFFYDFLNPVAGTIAAVAAFEPLTRTTYLSPKYDPKNILDNLIIMHEFIHVTQDTQDRQDLPYPVYLTFAQTQQLKSLGLHEATAYVKEIFMLNLFTRNQFRRDVIRSQGRVNPQTYLTVLHARADQAGTIELLAQMAYRLYNSRTSLTGIDSSFLAFVNSIYRSKGFTPYMRTPNGFRLDPN